MLGTVRGRPPAPPEPQYRRAAEAINAKVGQFLVGPVNFLPRALAFDVDPAAIREVARVLRDEPEIGCDFISCVSGVDMGDHMQVVYHCHSLWNVITVQMRVRLDREKPTVDSLVPIWPGANWLERETYDLLGVHFTGHPDLRRIMLSDDFVGHPLRKDYLPPAYQGRVSER